ncbi:Ca-activated chloride channel family protein [Chitinophaga sp. YR573]|uniref:YfbK domain-containing protein n=1 Tax=Chitinophaga sp. YR573 TaxID=1881040 RepID=UPI0008AD8C35|nr:von Willebrand factor type A domain-containing protein [Chitinophaga sp. YR573]SEW15645.1 Ca-activated chloride channel family protein [Chitinophaga sp. YR573]
MQKYLFLLLVGLVSLNAQAQRIITGTVSDSATKAPLAGAVISISGSSAQTTSNAKGVFKLTAPTTAVTIQVTYSGYGKRITVVQSTNNTVNILLARVKQDLRIKDVKRKIIMEDEKSLSEVVVTGYASPMKEVKGRVAATQISPSTSYPGTYFAPVDNTETYNPINENNFHTVSDQPLSTFSIDVDRASYTNIRRFLNSGQLPPADAVRVEEMINYFDYQYKNPTGKDPVAIYSDMAVCPWEPSHQLVRVALKAKDVPKENLPPSNLVFLIDVSGSMADENKLPLVKQAMKALVQQLRTQDRVAIVVYAGSAGLVLPSTSGGEKKTILDALDRLEAGGSTAGGEGIKLAYSTAASNFKSEGNNRVIIATDGDFNVGPSSDGDLLHIIEKERDKGIFLSVLGFGMGNYKDSKLELLSDKGNGNYAYIDNFEEARRTFVTEFGGTLYTVAKDVKLQIEFNPKYVQAYRLVGYENRMLQNEDFNNDKKDAGEMGAGHTVTALYEVIAAGNNTEAISWVDPLKYQQQTIIGGNTAEVLTVKLRYKQPQSNSSQLLSQVLPWKNQPVTATAPDFQMATAVAAFGLLLRNSEYKGQATYDQVLALAGKAKGEDPEGYRAEFIQLVKKAMIIKE